MALHDVDNEIRQMLANFSIPSKDELTVCQLHQKENPSIWNAAIFFHEVTDVPFYKNIFHFWVRAFFFYSEDHHLGSLFANAGPFIKHEEIDNKDFEIQYFKLLAERNTDDHFLEGQQFNESRVEIYDRSFQRSYKIIDIPNLKSFVSYSDNDYVALFKNTVF